MTQAQRQQAIRAMMLAAQRGFDPYNSHAVQARKWDDIERMKGIALARSRSEHDANIWLRNFNR